MINTAFTRQVVNELAQRSITLTNLEQERQRQLKLSAGVSVFEPPDPPYISPAELCVWQSSFVSPVWFALSPTYRIVSTGKGTTVFSMSAKFGSVVDMYMQLALQITGQDVGEQPGTFSDAGLIIDGTAFLSPFSPTSTKQVIMPYKLPAGYFDVLLIGQALRDDPLMGQGAVTDILITATEANNGSIT